MMVVCTQKTTMMKLSSHHVAMAVIMVVAVVVVIAGYKFETKISAQEIQRGLSFATWPTEQQLTLTCPVPSPLSKSNNNDATVL
jgi:hypothetical protein